MTIILAIIAALGLIGFGILLMGMCRVAQDADRRMEESGAEQYRARIVVVRGSITDIYS